VGGHIVRIGVLFPTIEIGGDPVAIRDWAQSAEELGYDHIWLYENILGFNENPDRSVFGAITPDRIMDEPLVLLGFLAGITRRVGLVAGVVVLPQRETTLLAKQAAEVDALSGGRLRLGVGVGYKARAMAALGADFHTRGRKIEEQIALLRRLWSEDGVTFEGQWHHIPDSGGILGPRPVQQPIPIWVGGSAAVVVQRAARLADGWINTMPAPDEHARTDVESLRAHVVDAGRQPAEVGLQVWALLAGQAGGDLAAHAVGWREIGATHYAVDTSGLGLMSTQAHIDELRKVRSTLADEFAVA
jgi:probable F420-dependent oxidoreductase